MSSEKETLRVVDVDPLFDNTRINLTGPNTGKAAHIAKVPYTIEQTWRKPNGDRQDYLEKTKGMTTMQRHAAFFDGDADGVIWPSDTFFAFLSLGFGLILSTLSVFIIHGPFSYPTIPTTGNRWRDYLPDPYMRIWVANIQRCKHGSDSESFNRRGEFQKERFENLFKDYSSAKDKSTMSFSDIMVMMKERRNLVDPFGWFAEVFEWGSTYMLLWPKDGKMKLDDMHGVLDGSIFVVLAKSRKGAFKVK